MYTAYDYLTDVKSFEAESTRKFLENSEMALVMRAKALLTESEELLVLSEEAKKESKDGFFKRAVEKLKEIWMRFLATVKRVSGINSEWLKKYRQGILNSDLSKFEYEIIPYSRGVKSINNAKIPMINVNSSQFEEASKDETSMFKFLFPNFSAEVEKVMTANKDIDEVGAFKQIFRGGSKKKLSGSELKTEVVRGLDYCIQYNDISNRLKSDQANLKRISDLGEKELASTMTQRKDAKPSVNPAVEKKEDKQASSGQVGESYNFLLEAEEKAQEKYEKKISDSNSAMGNARDEKKTLGANDNNSRQTTTDKAKSYRTALTLSMRVVGAKLSVLEERYNETIKLLRILAKKSKGNDNAQQDIKQGGEDVKKEQDSKSVKDTVKEKAGTLHRKGKELINKGKKRLFGDKSDTR